MSYGRNFEVTVPPHGQDRRGRFYNDGPAIPIGAPVLYALTGTAGAANALGLEPVVLAAGALVAPTELSGLAVYEYGPNGYAGTDPVLTTYSDQDVVPAGAAVQVVRGSYVKVRYTNTVASTFLNSTAYAGRTMIPTAGLLVGDFLGLAAVPNDTNGYFAETAIPGDAWLVVTAVDVARDQVEAQMTF